MKRSRERSRVDTKKTHDVKEDVIPNLSSQIADYKTIELTIFNLLEKNTLPELVTLIFALLRDRSYLLVHIYQMLIKKTQSKTVPDDQKERIQYILKNVFTKLWFISFKVSFPKEMIAMFELDYIMKTPVLFSKIHKGLSNTLYPSYKDYIFRALNIDTTILLSGNTNVDHKRISSIYYYYDNFTFPITDNQFLFDVDFTDQRKLKNYYMKFNTEPNTLLYKMNMEYTGLHIKLRRILVDLITYIIIEKIYPLSFQMSYKFSSDVIQILKESLTVYIKNIYTSNIGVIISNMDINQKITYFNKFIIFNNIFDEFLHKIKDSEKAKYKELFDNFYIEIGASDDNNPPDFLVNIVLKVEKEISFPDEKPFYYYFRDDANDDRLMLDTQHKYAWLYEYYDKESGTIKKLNGEELVKMESKLSNFWYIFTRYKLSLYSPNKQLMFSKKTLK